MDLAIYFYIKDTWNFFLMNYISVFKVKVLFNSPYCAYYHSVILYRIFYDDNNFWSVTREAFCYKSFHSSSIFFFRSMNK